MTDKNFWPVLDEMVRILKGGPVESEAILDRLEAELRALPEDKRHELRHDMQVVVGQLSRLTLRIHKMDE